MSTRPLSKSIFRAIGMFSGVKMLSIVCSLIRNKLIAVLIGPAGMGLISLYNATIEMISSIVRLSIDQSAIRDISKNTDEKHAEEISNVVRHWSVFLGIAGALFMCAISPILSIWTFGNAEKWQTFCALSLVPLATTIAAGRTALMTGLNRLGNLAKASAYSAILAVALSATLLWWLGKDAIIPMLIGNAMAILITALIFTPRIRRIHLPIREIWQRGSGFIRLGILMTASAFVSYLFSYLFLIYLNKTATISDVGIYQTGYTLINTYIGVIFAGVWVEYYPRLSRAIHSARSTSAIACHEIKITLTILLPIALIFVAADELIVRLLYDKVFLDVLPFLSIGIIGIIFRTFSWCLSFVILAKGDGKTFIFSESIDAAIGLTLNIVGWNLGGFIGLGISYVCWYMVYCVIVYYIYRHRYGLSMPKETIWLTLFMAIIVIATLSLKIVFGWWAAAIAAIITIPLCLRVQRRHSKYF